MTELELESRKLTRQINKLAKIIQAKRFKKDKIPLRKSLLMMVEYNRKLKHKISNNIFQQQYEDNQKRIQP